jgi:PAS domain S-box-containing protein
MLVPTTALTSVEIRSAIVRDPLVVTPDTSVRDAIAQMSGARSYHDSLETSIASTTRPIVNLFQEARSSCVVVVEAMQVVGILTERDIVRLCAEQQPLHCLTVGQVMVHPILTLAESDFTDAFVAIHLLLQHNIRHLLILDSRDGLIGFVTHETLNHSVGPEAIEQRASLAAMLEKQNKAKQALKENEIRWQFALEVTGDGVWDWRVESNQVFLSHTWKTMLGYADHEVGNTIKEWDNRVHPDDKAHCYSELQKHFSNTIPIYQAEHRLLCKDGSYKWILARGKVIEWDEVGRPIRIIGTHADISDRKQAEEQLQYLIEGTAATTGADFFPALVSHITKALNIPYALVTERVDQILNTLAFSADRVLQPNFSYPLAKTPCERVVQDGAYYCEALVQEQFPEDLDLVALEAQSYLGIALCDNQGKSIGHLCILGKNPIQEPLRAEQILRVFAARASAELERKRAIQALEQLNQELENKVKARTVALEISEKRYRALMNGASDAILLADMQGNLIEVNQKAEALFGYSRKELACLHISQIHSPEAFVVGQEHFKNTTLNHICPTFESTILRKDLSLVPVEITASCIDLEGENVVQGIFRDISERKAAELKINQHLATIEAAIDGIGIMQDNAYIYLNQAHLSLFGYESAEELLGKSWEPLYPLEERERIEQDLYPILLRDRSWQGEATAIRKDGSTFDQGLSLSLTEDGLIICVCRDISEQKASLQERQKAEARLQQTNQELARATRLKDEFLANMSHELRTPLNAILGMTEGLQDQVFGEIKQPQIKALQTIARSASHLLELIDDILDVAKIESGQIELECTPTNVALLCRSSLAFITQQALKKRIQVEIKLPFNLPDLYVDERRVRQVLINLLTNAVKFTPEGGSITIKASNEQYPINGVDFTDSTLSKNFLYISVIDTGIGIASEQIDRLFKPFIQIDSALNRQYTGTGLGLALVKRIVELHGGRVGLSSEVKIGSCFTIALPCITSTTSLPSIQKSSCNSSEISQLGQQITPLILLAEDNESNIFTISSYLGAKGYDLLVATNGREAIAMALAEKPDLILMDIQMPEMDGLEAIQQIRSNPDLAKTPIIALTALAMSGDKERCLAAGANDYISKPIKLKHLTTTIQQILFS